MYIKEIYNNMTTTTTSIRIDKEIKDQADELFDNLGMSLTTAINVFLRQSVRRQKIPFEIENTPNETTLQAISESQKTSEKVYHDFTELFSDMEESAYAKN